MKTSNGYEINETIFNFVLSELEDTPKNKAYRLLKQMFEAQQAVLLKREEE